MREIRLYGSEGGGAVRSPYPYQGGFVKPRNVQSPVADKNVCPTRAALRCRWPTSEFRFIVPHLASAQRWVSVPTPSIANALLTCRSHSLNPARLSFESDDWLGRLDSLENWVQNGFNSSPYRETCRAVSLHVPFLFLARNNRQTFLQGDIP